MNSIALSMSSFLNLYIFECLVNFSGLNGDRSEDLSVIKNCPVPLDLVNV